MHRKLIQSLVAASLLGAALAAAAQANNYNYTVGGLPLIFGDMPTDGTFSLNPGNFLNLDAPAADNYSAFFDAADTITFFGSTYTQLELYDSPTAFSILGHAPNNPHIAIELSLATTNDLGLGGTTAADLLQAINCSDNFTAQRTFTYWEDYGYSTQSIVATVLSITPAPEPSALALAMAGGSGAGWFFRRRR